MTENFLLLYTFFMVKILFYIMLNWFVVDFVVLSSTIKTLRIKMSFAKVMVLCLLSILFKSFTFVLGNTRFLRVLILFSAQNFLALIVFVSQKETNYLRILATMFTYIFLMYGITFVLAICFDIRFNTFNKFFTMPIWLVSLSLFLYGYFLLNILCIIKERKIVGKLFRKVKVLLMGKEFIFSGYIDSGNMLKEPVSGSPVLILSKQSLKKQVSKEFFSLMQEDKLNTMIGEKVKKIKYSTLSGFCSYMYVIKPEALKIIGGGEKEKELLNCFVGVVDYNFNKFDMLLSRDCM